MTRNPALYQSIEMRSLKARANPIRPKQTRHNSAMVRDCVFAAVVGVTIGSGLLVWRNWEAVKPVLHSSGATVIDGDTIEVAGERIRISNIDTPEISSPNCPAEQVKGFAAKRRLAEIARGYPIDIDREGKDRFGRTLARVRIAGNDVGLQLIQEGHALPWAPGAAAKQSRIRAWCGS
ncbi:thermonuclease family protein [Prosthecomicrobium sp. N25]|uniref:thermonuclease family protein n=1 Tax=Prosthecomicrobium sp. N25 TaxID=3129254 RepID=UPI003078573D